MSYLSQYNISRGTIMLCEGIIYVQGILTSSIFYELHTVVRTTYL